MAKKKLERVFRDRELNPDEVARDKEIDRKVEEEFPPAPSLSNKRIARSRENDEGMR